jgi:hypothetical protein
MSTETPWPTPLPSPHQDENPQPSAGPDRPAARADVVAFAVVAVIGVVAAFGVGALWRATAPAVLGVVSQGGVYYAGPETKTFVARDGWFALYAVIAAILLALFAFLRYRRGASVGAALGLAIGGIAGGYLASWFGKLIGPGRGSIDRAAHAAASGANFNLPLIVRATGVIWLWPAFAAGLFFLLMLLFGPSEPEHELQPFPGWGEEENEDEDEEPDALPEPPQPPPPPASAL